MNVKRHAIPFVVPIVRREASNHATDCYFCMVPPVSEVITEKNKWTIVYPNIPSALRPVPHGEGISAPEPPKEFTIDSEDEDEGEPTSGSPEPPASTEPHVPHSRSSCTTATHSHTGRTERSCSRSVTVQNLSKVTGIKT